MSIRGSGITSRQMKAAPKGAIFVWNNEQTNYPVELAKVLGRQDLQICTPFTLASDTLVAKLRESTEAIVIDHALTPKGEVARNLASLAAPGRQIITDAPAPSLNMQKLDASVVPWSQMGTGLIIRDASYKVLARMKFVPLVDASGPTASRDVAMSLMERLANLINEKSSVTEAPDAKPSQEVSEPMDRDQALKIVQAVLSNPGTPKALKKKFSDALGPLL